MATEEIDLRLKHNPVRLCLNETEKLALFLIYMSILINRKQGRQVVN